MSYYNLHEQSINKKMMMIINKNKKIQRYSTENEIFNHYLKFYLNTIKRDLLPIEIIQKIINDGLRLIYQQKKITELNGISMKTILNDKNKSIYDSIITHETVFNYSGGKTIDDLIIVSFSIMVPFDKVEKKIKPYLKKYNLRAYYSTYGCYDIRIILIGNNVDEKSAILFGNTVHMNFDSQLFKPLFP